MPKKKGELSKRAQGIITKFQDAGMRKIESALRSKNEYASRKTITDFLQKLKGTDYESFKYKDFDKKVFANYRGAWLFDIIYSRGLVKKSTKQRREQYPEDEYPRHFAIFMNTNSGYVFYYASNNQSKVDLQSFQKQFKHDLEKTFPKYPIVSVQSDEQSGWDNKDNYLGDKTQVKKYKDTYHVIMSKINAFANHMRNYIYKQEGRFDPDNDPIKLHRFEEFVDRWNSLKVPGMDCTREEMMRDEKKEVLYIVNCLFGNMKKEEEMPKFEKDDVITVKAPYNDEFVKNKQQKAGQITPGKYKLIASEGNTITIQNIAQNNDVHTIHRRYVAGVQRHALNDVEEMIAAQRAATKKKEEANRAKAKSHYIPSKPFKTGDKVEEAKWLLNVEDHKWENIGFPSEWSAEKRYHKLLELLDKIEDANQKNIIIGPIEMKTLRTNARKRQEVLKRFLETTKMPYPWHEEQNIKNTDGYDKSEHILKKRGKPKKIEYAEESIHPMMTRSRTKSKKL